MRQPFTPESNVLFVTLDACRYDTTLAAHIPNLRALGPIRRAGTHGTYTLPSHMSFFMGYLPAVIDAPHDPFYTPEVRQMWRLASGRQRDPATIGLEIQAENVVLDYRRRGYKTIGCGGVRWFRHPALQSQFESFHFYGENDHASVFNSRQHREFPLNHTDELIREIASEPYFLFMNCPETHVPYDFGEGDLNPAWRRIIEKYRNLWGAKRATFPLDEVDQYELRELQNAQIAALESVDRRLGRLIRDLPKPLLVIVSGDHGECFGEDRMWGHGYPHEKVMEVPLVITQLT
jgi:hypothetical protein